ncbi:MAG: hypothetical protein EBR02_09645 [Alphaproteobacteria bacterium]|nr:hypothetical protein [Alphaproteobacteria bacterium]
MWCLRGFQEVKHSADKLFVTDNRGYLLLPQIHKFFGHVLVGAFGHIFPYLSFSALSRESILIKWIIGSSPMMTVLVLLIISCDFCD